MTGLVGYRTLKFREELTGAFKQNYSKTLGLTSVHTMAAANIFLTKWEEKNLLKPEKM